MLLNDNKIAFCHSRNIISIVDPFNDYYYSIIIGKSVYRSFFQLNDLSPKSTNFNLLQSI